MGFNLNRLHYQVTLSLLIYNLTISTVLATRNVTIDDQDSSITYSPPGAWSQSTQSTLDFGGAHTLTQNSNATASFNFTGRYYYYFSLVFSSSSSSWCHWFCLFFCCCSHLFRHRDIFSISAVALYRQHSCITRFWTYHCNRSRGSQSSEYRSRPRDCSISSCLECYWVS